MSNNEQLRTIEKALNTQIKDLLKTSHKDKWIKSMVSKSREVANLSSKILKVISMRSNNNKPKLRK